MVIQTQSSVYFALLVRRGELLINFGNQKIYSNIRYHLRKCPSSPIICPSNIPWL